MSKPDELLDSLRGRPGAANPAIPANPEGTNSTNSTNSRWSGSKTGFTPELERRICAMAARWNYSPDDYNDVLQRAKRNPAAWEQAVSLDEEREAEFRKRGLLARTSA
jgi:hypothetical protein